MNGKMLRRITGVLIAFLILIYVTSQVYIIRHTGIITEKAVQSTVLESLQTTAIALRSEIVIDEPYNGILNCTVADGDKVEKNGVIAEIYTSESDAAAQNQILRLQKEIDNLAPLTETNNYYASNPSIINMQIYGSLEEILDSSRKNGFSKISDVKENLQYALNRKQLIVGMSTAQDYQARVTELESQRNSLIQSSGEKINTLTAPESGYFINSIDGLENAYNIDNIRKITVAEVRDLQSRSTDKIEQTSSQIGKICRDFSWYLVGVFSPEDAGKFDGLTSVTLDVPYASTERIPASIVARNVDALSGEAAIVFECSYMDSGIVLLRNETIQINVKSYTGVLVKQEALHFADIDYTEYDADGNPITKTAKNVMGVYVKYGGRLQFVQVFSDKMINGYVVCKITLSDSEREALVTDNTIRLYDEVVVEGTDLYDGKFVQ